MKTTIFKILVCLVLFGLTASIENTIIPVAESQLSLSQLDSTAASATMRSYSGWKNHTYLLYLVPIGASLLLMRKEVTQVIEEAVRKAQ